MPASIVDRQFSETACPECGGTATETTEYYAVGLAPILADPVYRTEYGSRWAVECDCGFVDADDSGI